MKTLKLSMLACAALTIGLISCGKKDTPAPTPVPAVTKTDSISVGFNYKGPFTFYNFKNGAVVASTDSASTKWDIGFRNVEMIINSHSSGPGNGGAITQMIGNGITFESLKSAPQTGYAYDTSATQRAINKDSKLGWYNYDPGTHAFSSKADRFFIIRTADGKYVKMEIVRVDYADFVGANPVTLIYKIRYSYQAEGSLNF